MAVASPSSSSGQTVSAEPKSEQPPKENLSVSSSLPTSDPSDLSNPLVTFYSSPSTVTSSSPSFPVPPAPSPMSVGSVPSSDEAPHLPSFPSFRPFPPIPVGAPQFSPIPNPSIQPPGVAPVIPPVTVPSVRYLVTPQPYSQMPNGYPAAPVPLPVPSMSPGIFRYPSPYSSVVRPPFPLRPPGAVGTIPPWSRPPMPAIRGVSPMIDPGIRPIIPIVPVAEKPQTTVYVGKIPTTVENDFLLSLLRLCGPVKSWKRAQDPSTGAPKGYGFCEFEAAEGVLRALRLLSNLSIDGKELMLNVSQATRDYLERCVEGKKEKQKVLKEGSSENAEKEESIPVVDASEASLPGATDAKQKDDPGEKLDAEAAKSCIIVTLEDQEGDKEALEKLTSMLEERAKSRSPPPQGSADACEKSNCEVISKSRDGGSDVDIMKSDAAEGQHDDETTSEQKPSSDHERTETGSSDRGRYRRNIEGDHEHEMKREKGREIERYERERERVRREREREHKLREVERLYKDRVKDWESREREKEYQRLHEREREKEREWERQREIKEQEDGNDDDDSKKRRRKGNTYEERRKRQREKEDDIADRLREEEEIAEASRRSIEDEKKKAELKVSPIELSNGNREDMETDGYGEEVRDGDRSYEADHGDVHDSDSRQNNVMLSDEPNAGSIILPDLQQTSHAPVRKLGFGLVGSKRAAVPSVFHAEDDEDGEKEKKMRPLVPIDYSTEELQAVQPASLGASANLDVVAEFAKHISGNNVKEERSELEKEKSWRVSNRSSQSEKGRVDSELKERTGGKGRDKEQAQVIDKKTSENKKLLDAKQLIDTIPKTKEELLSYNIDWAIYDKHDLHERMRPWISKKITEFLGEEEATLVEYIVSSTKEHVKASQMLELLQSILDEEAEMFVLKMWRMLIFEIKKVETGLSVKSRA